MSGTEVDVAIVGAGAAGVAAGRRLAAAGLKILLVEARDRLGGRGYTVAGPAGSALDLGCGWLHSGDLNPWVPIVERQGRTVDRSPPPWAKPALEAGFPAEEQADWRAANESFSARLASADLSDPDRPVSDMLEPGSRWNGMLGAISSYVSGAEPERVSARDLRNYADSGVNWRVREGFGAVIATHGAGLPVALGRPARRIDHSGRRLRIETDHGTVEAGQAIVTVPSALIAAEAISFFPALPEKVEAAQGLPLGLADKLYLALDGAEAFPADSRVFGRTDRTATASYQLRPLGAPLVEAYFGGACAAALERGGVAAFAAFAREELAGVFGADFTKRVTPLAMHLWAADPFSRGAYSYAVPGRAADREVLAAPIDGKLFFAGEATSVHDYSTAHGALSTGLRAAEEVLAARRR
ncbi:flavin monoamine oxidase family protein [Hansschlegelia zhihuaiae]|uniref:Tryptophan 2-monooxygenase n=1 Tax=Hansschlegelia zhihuaiae TaxID=405005 RepID=A0A4Q0MHR0_9HYPH|nr:NAD(P)/FAD-dependent oxidoreductase [Hansschlegelia zhihuaiae]RXF72974.1 FAD-dependent oxidoreductase [Hansschlegelia zhihuaiae]